MDKLIQQALHNIQVTAGNIFGGVQQFQKGFQQGYNQSQPINYIQTPKFQQDMGTILKNPYVKQVTNTIGSQPLLQNYLQPVNLQGNKLPFSPTIGQYTQGQIVKPLKIALDKSKPALDRATSGLQAGFSLTPAGTLYNVVGGATAGVLKSARTGTDFNKNVSQAISEPSDIGGTGLGIKNPLLAMGVDFATANPKAGLRQLANAKGFLKNMNGEDLNAGLKAIENFALNKHDLNYMVNQGIEDTKTIDYLAQKYIGKQFAKDAPIEQKAQEVLNWIRSQQNRPAITLGIKGKAANAGIDEAKFKIKTAAKDIDAELNAKPSQLNGQDVQNPIDTELLVQSPESQLQIQGQKMANQKVSLSSGGSIPPTANSDNYLKELIKKQDQARENPVQGVKTKLGSWYRQLKAQLVDSTAPIEDVLNDAEKRFNYKVRPTGDVRLQIDRVYRAPTLAGQFAKDNGLVKVIQDVPDVQALDQYLIAKQATQVEKNGIVTGRNLAKDEQLIKDLAPIYEPYAQQVIQYGQKLLDYVTETGQISKELADALKKKYPEYVPLNRIFNALEEKTVRYGTKGVASLSKQSTVQKLKGSTREIENPIASLLSKTQTAFEQGERNVAAKQLASYRDLPGFEGLIREVPKGENNPAHTFSYLDNGVKRSFETTPEIEAAAKSLDKQQMNLVLKIINVPTRLLRLGATGLNYPFAISNLAKDQVSGFINSGKATSTSNPVAFTQGLFAALGHGELYQDMVRNAAGGTSFDIGREASNLAVKKLRANKNIATNSLYVVTHPLELVRAVENIIGRTEELTRAQQYKGTLDALLKEGRTLQDAKLLAAKAARENTVNFARGGNFTRALNWILPYFNAGVQGSRTFMRNMQNRPIQTTAKFAISAGMPVAAATLWNLSDPTRKQVYDDIPEFEKQNSIIIIPPNPTKDDNGKWNVIKIPLSQEIAALTSIVRRPIEQAAGLDPVKVSEMASALFQTATSLNTQTGTGLASSLTPQIAKPLVEATLNKNLYTGQDIVPDYLRNLPANEQIKKGTPERAKMVGNLLGISPLLVQNEANTILGGLGGQLIGTKGFDTALESRFMKASGGETQRKIDAQVFQGLNPKETQAYSLLHTPKAVDAQGNPIQDNGILNTQQKAVLYLNFPKLQAIEAIKAQAEPNHDPIWDLTPAQRNLVFAAQTGLPNQANTYKKVLQTQPWYQPFLAQRDSFYNSLPAQPQTPTDFPKPLPSPYVQSQMDAKNWSDPQVKAYLDANTAYNNHQLAQMGLPPVDTSSGYGSMTPAQRLKGQLTRSKVKSPGSFKVNKTKSPKLAKVKVKPLAKVKTKKFKIAKLKVKGGVS